MSEITVVIPNYNGMKYLPECMISLCERQENAPEYEVLIIDNASADGSVEYLEKEWCRKSGVRVSLIPMSENTGFCHAVNLGISKAQSPYVILLNNDTKVEPGFLRGLYDAIREDERIFSVSAKMLMWDRPELIDDAGDRYCVLGWAYSRGKGRPADKYEKNVRVFSACGGAAIYRRSVFEEIGYFDENHFAYLEDLDIGWRAQIFGHRSYLEPGAEVFHAGSATAGGKYSDFKEVMTAGNNALLQYKNMPFLQYWLNAPLRSLGTAVKKAYFTRKGLGDADAEGIRRGEFLKASCAEYTECIRYGIPYKKCSIPQEAGFPEQKEDLMEVLPIYLGRKIPFEWRHFPHYLSIQGQLLAGLFRRRPSV